MSAAKGATVDYGTAYQQWECSEGHWWTQPKRNKEPKRCFIAQGLHHDPESVTIKKVGR